MDGNKYTVQVLNNCKANICYKVSFDNGNGCQEVYIDSGNLFTNRSNTKYNNIKGMVWEKGKTEEWKPTFSNNLDYETSNHELVVTPIFGPRIASSIKVLLACLAGPVDPNVRNDLILINKFKEIGVPSENIFMLLERQCTPDMIKASLQNLVYNSQEGDIIFIYLGGCGNKNSDGYYLNTWEGETSSKELLSILQKCKSEIFMIVDSSFSGQMIDDFKTFKNNPKSSIIASTQSYNDGYTGWRLLQMLIENVFTIDTFTDPKTIMNYIEKNFSTSSKTQKAQIYSNF